MTYPPQPPVLSGDDYTYPLLGHDPGPVNTDPGDRTPEQAAQPPVLDR